MMDVKRAVEEALSEIKGLPLSSMWRYAGMQKFEFGEQKPFINRKGQAAHQADLGLVVTCDWAIYGHEGKIVSSEEFLPHGERRDAYAHWFYKRVADNPPFVQEILAEADGKVTLILSEGFRLDILPFCAFRKFHCRCASLGADFGTWWNGRAC